MKKPKQLQKLMVFPVFNWKYVKGVVSQMGVV